MTHRRGSSILTAVIQAAYSFLNRIAVPHMVYLLKHLWTYQLPTYLQQKVYDNSSNNYDKVSFTVTALCVP
jgi:hypothetical protein